MPKVNLFKNQRLASKTKNMSTYPSSTSAYIPLPLIMQRNVFNGNRRTVLIFANCAKEVDVYFNNLIGEGLLPENIELIQKFTDVGWEEEVKRYFGRVNEIVFLSGWLNTFNISASSTRTFVENQRRLYNSSVNLGSTNFGIR